MVTATAFAKIKQQHPTVPNYPQDDGSIKLPAGWLIEKSGWKGFREGDYGVHTKQALVLVNYGNSAGSDIYHLSSRILEDVKEKFGIELEREVNVIGSLS